MSDTIEKDTNIFERKIADLKAQNLYRRMRTVEGAQSAEIVIDGKRVLLMCSNNYLGLADHPALIEAAAKAAREYGVGAGASRLVSGSMEPHRELENRLAAFKNTERCLLFNSGYQANLGVISALASKEDVIYSDALNHASIIDGARLSRATVRVYPHLDVAALEEMLKAETVNGRKIIVTDGVFSMDGDVAPLKELVRLKQQFDAILIVDEAHATGVVGPGGRGVAAELGVENEIDVIVGTLGKAFGGFGAFAAGRAAIIEWLINKARSFIFSTALPPTVIATSLAALDILEREPERVEKLKWAAEYFRDRLIGLGFNIDRGEIPIIPLIIGDAREALEFASALFDKGVFCHAIRPPTVPKGTSRLRMTVMATHTKEQLDRAVSAIAETAKKKGITR